MTYCDIYISGKVDMKFKYIVISFIFDMTLVEFQRSNVQPY